MFNTIKFKINSLRYPLTPVYKFEEFQKANHIIVGPWLGELGSEVLYWVPFVRWFKNYSNINRDRFTVISRGNTALWYRDIADNYIEIFDYFSPEEFKHLNIKREKRSKERVKKQMNLTKFDIKVLKTVNPHLYRDFYEGKFKLFHPSLMFKMFTAVWMSPFQPLDFIFQHSNFGKWPSIEFDPRQYNLPKEYVTAKFYFNKCFPATDENKKFVCELLKNITKKSPVVLLSTGIEADEHSDFFPVQPRNVYLINDLVNARNNLDIQTKIISRAKAFVGTYGGFSYLPPFYGIPTLSFYSLKNFFNTHLDLARRIFSNPTLGKYDALNTNSLGLEEIITKLNP